MDCITQTVFGIKVDAVKNPETEFMKKCDLSFETWRFMLATICPLICKVFGIGIFNPKVLKFMEDMSKQVIKERDANNIQKDDVVGLMMKIRDQGTFDSKTDDLTEYGLGSEVKSYKLDDYTIGKTLMQFFTDGFETVGLYLSLCLYFISINPEVQYKARDEVDEINEKYGDDLTGEAVNSLKYLDQIFSETGRLFPIGATGRLCTKNWTIPGTNITIPKGTRVTIPVYPLQMDPQFIPEPEKFMPERFSGENRSKILTGTYMPFGTGTIYEILC